MTDADRYPMPIEVSVGAGWMPATAHAARAGRLGEELLVTLQHTGATTMRWLPRARVRIREDPARDGHHARDEKGAAAGLSDRQRITTGRPGGKWRTEATAR